MTLEWQQVFHALPFLWEGTRVTVAASLLALAPGLVVGLFVVLGLPSSVKALRALLIGHIRVVRGTPPFMQTLLVYFVFPSLGRARPVARMWAIRVVRTRVFPVPAPASTSTAPSSVTTASRCSGLRSLR